MILIVFILGPPQGGSTPLTRFDIGISTLFNQILDHIKMPGTGGFVQGGPTIGILFVHHLLILGHVFLEHAQITLLGSLMSIGGTRGETGFVLLVETTRVCLTITRILGRPFHNVGRQGVIFVFVTRFQCLEGITVGLIDIMLLGIQSHIVTKRMPRGFKVDKDIGHVSALEWKGTSVQNGMTFVQDHISRQHGNIFRLAVVTNHLQGPGFIDILRHI
mmetsp:Transcript_32416/g.67603  ORF Transcript_32416/g.67603 Transcript_32416/m.67603 type:complete len:218 (-) Transcript_32416:816-1469(-)